MYHFPSSNDLVEFEMRNTDSLVNMCEGILVKRALDKYNIIPPDFFLKSWDFETIKSVGIGNTCIPILTLLYFSYFQRNMNIFCIFYISKMTSVNTQYSGL